MNFGLAIRIPDVAIRILDVECVSESEKVNFGLPIWIPDVAIWIQIPESFLNSEKVKNGLAIRILCVKVVDKSWICTPKKMHFSSWSQCFLDLAISDKN